MKDAPRRTRYEIADGFPNCVECVGEQIMHIQKSWETTRDLDADTKSVALASLEVVRHNLFPEAWKAMKAMSEADARQTRLGKVRNAYMADAYVLHLIEQAIIKETDMPRDAIDKIMARLFDSRQIIKK